MIQRSIQVFPDPRHLSAAAAELIAQLASDAIARRGNWSIALSGDLAYQPVYDQMASEDFARKIDWTIAEIYFTDESCVPPVNPESHFRMASEALLDALPIKPENIHRIKGEIEPQQSAIEYGRLLKEKFGDVGPDIVLLGIAEDAHTAGLFPGTAALTEMHHRCVANFIPPQNAWRVTMSAPFINRAGNVIVLVAGDEKAKCVADVLEGPLDPTLQPMQLIDPTPGTLHWLMDAGAAGMNEEESDE
jgi:6-phosphogluconolactonase